MILYVQEEKKICFLFKIIYIKYKIYNSKDRWSSLIPLNHCSQLPFTRLRSIICSCLLLSRYMLDGFRSSLQPIPSPCSGRHNPTQPPFPCSVLFNPTPIFFFYQISNPTNLSVIIQVQPNSHPLLLNPTHSLLSSNPIF